MLLSFLTQFNEKLIELVNLILNIITYAII